MANDRLFLVCTQCSGSLCLLKYYPDASYSPLDTIDTLQTFMKHHLEECHRWFGSDLGPKGDQLFRVGNESDTKRSQ
jgi:hypothetical protein